MAPNLQALKCSNNAIISLHGRLAALNESIQKFNIEEGDQYDLELKKDRL
jgi:hypothetical protein